MKVLFLGEFSGVYTELIPALRKKGIETYLISTGDGYKGYQSDYSVIYNVTSHNIFLTILRKVGFAGAYHFYKMWPTLKQRLRDNDIVQLNNDFPFQCGWIVMLYILNYIFKHNQLAFLSAWGDDFVINTYSCHHGHHRFRSFTFTEKYCFVFKQYLKRYIINRFVLCHVKAIMPGMFRYRDAYLWNKKTTEIFPFAIRKERIGTPIHIEVGKPIVIFHGWQIGREKTKGNEVFDKVIRKVVEKYGSKVNYVVVQNIPYEEYVHAFNNCHIFIDQLYADDKGMNGLLGMAAGKVVFSGFKPEALALYPYYKGNEIGIMSYDDEDYLFSKFCELIENPQVIEKISCNAIDFVMHNHLDSIVAEHYIALWKSFYDNL